MTFWSRFETALNLAYFSLYPLCKFIFMEALLYYISYNWYVCHVRFVSLKQIWNYSWTYIFFLIYCQCLKGFISNFHGSFPILISDMASMYVMSDWSRFQTTLSLIFFLIILSMPEGIKFKLLGKLPNLLCVMSVISMISV